MNDFIGNISCFAHDLIFYVLCFIGIMYFFFRVNTFLNKLIRLL